MGAYPNEIEGDSAMDRFASFDGTGIAYMTAGDGPDVLLLHGFAADHRSTGWRPVWSMRSSPPGGG